MTAFRHVFLIWLILVAGISTGLAQTSNGTIIGTVTDSSGAAVVGATITVVSKETGAERKTLTCIIREDTLEGVFRDIG